MSLKLKVVTRCRDLKLLAKVMKAYLGIEDLNTMTCALQGSNFFLFYQKEDLTCVAHLSMKNTHNTMGTLE